MRRVYLNKDQFGLKYKENILSGWMYLPDAAQTLQGAKTLFTQDGRYEEPDFVFTDERLHPTTFYNIKGGRAIVNLDSKNEIILDEDRFLSYVEQIEYLKQFSDTDTIQDAERLTSDYLKLQHYKKQSGQLEWNGLKEMIQNKMTPEAIEKYCQDHAQKYYNSQASIQFEK
jgi:hypothetical protein